MIGLWIGISIYLLLVLAGAFMFRLWIIRWHLYVAAIVIAGALIGAAGFAALGPLLTDRPLPNLLRQGLRDGGFYALIWAPAISLVMCVMQAHRRRYPPRDNGA